ncbi:MAG: hypothetical protein GF313_02045 [Caldithrix sp.]|nr:hypothetical protein [Caldithrix sp.]
MAKTKRQNHKRKAPDWKALFFELIVVFLGVTAGFLLNNWQLDKKDKLQEKKYLNGFLQDVRANIETLKQAVVSDSLWMVQTQSKLAQIKAGTITNDSADVVIKRLLKLSKLNVKKGTYENITDSGNLNIITAYDLREQIVDYHVTISGVEFIDEYFYQYFDDYVMPFIFNNVNMMDATLIDSDVKGIIAFSNVVGGYYSMVQQRQTAYNDLL